MRRLVDIFVQTIHDMRTYLLYFFAKDWVEKKKVCMEYWYCPTEKTLADFSRHQSQGLFFRRSKDTIIHHIHITIIISLTPSTKYGVYWNYDYIQYGILSRAFLHDHLLSFPISKKKWYYYIFMFQFLLHTYFKCIIYCTD